MDGGADWCVITPVYGFNGSKTNFLHFEKCRSWGQAIRKALK
jgi:hypothetical protein